MQITNSTKKTERVLEFINSAFYCSIMQILTTFFFFNKNVLLKVASVLVFLFTSLMNYITILFNAQQVKNIEFSVEI
jgi:hypothetical protein